MADSATDQNQSSFEHQPLIGTQGRYCLDADEVHVWRLGLDGAAPELVRLEKMLSQDELELLQPRSKSDSSFSYHMGPEGSVHESDRPGNNLDVSGV